MKKIVFIDRDGVINCFPGFGLYVTKQEEFKFLPGAIQAIRILTDAGYLIFVISNQGCVARKQITLAALNKLTRRMCSAIARGGGKIQKVYYCIHQTSDECECKKPKVLLFKKALKGRKVNLKKTYFIGDSREDIEAGENLGCRKMLVLCGRSKRRDLKSFPVQPDVIKKNLLEAARWIVKQKS